MFDAIKKIFGGKDDTSRPNLANSANSAHSSATAGEMSDHDEMLKNSAMSLGATMNSSLRSGEVDANGVSALPRPPMDITAMDLPLPTPTELKLEALFHQASHESTKRNDFLNALMTAELFVVGQAEEGENGAMNIQLATQQAGEEPVALAFSSLSAMAQAGAPSGQAFVKMKTVDLLRMIRTQLGFVLNPGNRVAKHFNKWEVEQLSDASSGNDVREMPMPDNTSVSIGQPAQYPPGLRAALAKAAAEIEVVREVYTGLMSVSETQPPVMLAVITTNRELAREEFLTLINEFGPHLQPLGPIPLNFAPMNPNFRDLAERRALISATELLT